MAWMFELMLEEKPVCRQIEIHQHIMLSFRSSVRFWTFILYLGDSLFKWLTFGMLLVAIMGAEMIVIT